MSLPHLVGLATLAGALVGLTVLGRVLWRADLVVVVVFGIKVLLNQEGTQSDQSLG
jgi:hypothetical protein